MLGRFNTLPAADAERELLAAARARLGHDPATERLVVREELCKISRISRPRPERLLATGGADR